MEEREKLKHLVAHWEEHNSDHADTYRNWAGKMNAGGDDEAAGILEEIAKRTDEMGRLFQDLAKALK